MAEHPASIQVLLTELSALAETISEYVPWADPRANQVELKDAAGSGEGLEALGGRVEDGTYQSDAPALRLVADSVAEFLAWLVTRCRDPLEANEPRWS